MIRPQRACVRVLFTYRRGEGAGDDGAMSSDRGLVNQAWGRARSGSGRAWGGRWLCASWKALLYEAYLAAGAPRLDAFSGEIAGDDGLVGSPSRDTDHRVTTDGERPGQQADVVAVATVLARRAAWDALGLAGQLRELWVWRGRRREWQMRRVLRLGLIPPADVAGRWPASVVEDVLARLESLHGQVGALLDVGAARVEAYLTDRLELVVGRGTAAELARRGHTRPEARAPSPVAPAAPPAPGDARVGGRLAVGTRGACRHFSHMRTSPTPRPSWTRGVLASSASRRSRCSGG